MNTRGTRAPNEQGGPPTVQENRPPAHHRESRATNPTRPQANSPGGQATTDVRALSDRDLDDTIRQLTPVVSSALAELPLLPESVEEARTLLARCRIEQRRRNAGADAQRVGWVDS